MLEPDAAKLLKEFSVPYPEHGVARNAEEAVQIAERLGYPVVLKVVSPDVLHKSDVGGVVMDLADATAVQRGYGQMLEALQATASTAHIEGVLVCKQAPPGMEVIIGALEDITFGPVIMFGLGGVFTEVLKDVSFRLAPLQRRDAQEMVQEIRGYSVLKGTRGQAARDVDTLIDLLMAVSHLVSARPDIKELDLNPVRLYEKGLMVLDVRLITKAKDVIPVTP
jgi:acyl-CoA synthetase (NDP forming)